VLGGVFAIKTWLRGRKASSEMAANGISRESAEPVADPILTTLRPAAATRWITASVHQSRIVAYRRRNYAALASRLSRIDGARPLHPELPDTATPYVFPLYVHEPAASYLRLRSAGVPIFRWDQIWPGTPVLEGDHGVDWSDRVFQLGCHQDLSLHDIDAIAATVRAIIQS
jgi:hypothetical protein